MAIYALALRAHWEEVAARAGFDHSRLRVSVSDQAEVWLPSQHSASEPAASTAASTSAASARPHADPWGAAAGTWRREVQDVKELMNRFRDRILFRQARERL